MKYQIFFAALSLVVATKVRAQTAVSSNTTLGIAIGFKADVGNLFEKGAVPYFTDKYNGYSSAQIFFNSQLIKLTVFKQPADCSTGNLCTQMNEAPLEVFLQVKRVERFGCYDSYYAKTPDAVKSQILEQIIVHRFAGERCQTLLQAPEGSIHYKISGLNSETGESGSAEVYAKLLNVQIVRLEK